MKEQLINYVKAGFSGLYILTHEETRVEAIMTAVAKSTGYNLWSWSITAGMVSADGKESVPETDNPLAMLEKLPDIGQKSIILLRDFHLLLAEVNPVIFRKLKDQLMAGKIEQRVIVIVGCQLKLPPELEKEITVLEFKLPDRDQLLAILQSIADENEIKLNGHTDAVLDAAAGLTTLEAENAFALSIIESKDVTPEIIAREKSNTVRKNGLLEIIDDKITLADIGGLEVLKADLTTKRNLFSKEARDYGLPTPRGQLYCGQAGTGKSLCAKASASVFGIPLLRLEASRLFGSLVGETERNWRLVHATAKAIAPCVLWIDEVDGLFSGGESSGKTDGGTTSRTLKAMLQDMQFNSEGIFYAMTANDIDNLPDPLIDRLDVWSVDLPNKTEREAIWKIQIEKYRRKPAKFDLGEIADATEGFSGRQIEQVWIKALTVAFNAKREPSNKDVVTVAGTFVPTSKLMADVIEKRRKRLANRSMSASAPEPVKTGGRKLSV